MLRGKTRPMKRFRTGWISDIHLGSRGSKADALLQFLRDYEFEKLYIVGDFIDVWQLRRGIYWPQAHNDVIQKILRAGRKGTQVIYIPGNHDEFVAHFFGHFGAVEIMPRDIHTTADGRKLLVIHGHELDTVVQNIKWLAYVGDVGYQLLLKLNNPVNVIRRWMGLEYWSLSAYVKKSVKNAVSFIGAFEKAIVQYAQRDHVDGVVCGHIHTPVIRTIDSTTYYNSGDWVESLSALMEDFDGHIELIKDFATGVTSAPAPTDSQAEVSSPVAVVAVPTPTGASAPTSAPSV
jgi:UDP-2,3-diacylglucosamine pyrophosphatase LpxH